MKRLRCLCVICLIAVVVGCSGPTVENRTSDAIAVFEGGEITPEELDQAILALSPDQRQAVAGSGIDALQNFVREMALDRIILADPELVPLYSSPEVERELEKARRQIVAEAILNREVLQVEPITEDEIVARFEEDYAGRAKPERRLAYHIFKRLRPETDIEALRHEIEVIRQRVVAGESFSLLAKELSDSESRHADGAIGWVVPGQLAPDLDRLIFEIQPGVPSTPVATRDGVHLFMVEMALGGRDPSLDDMRVEIRRELARQRHRDRIEELLADYEAPPGSVVLSANEVATAVERGGEGGPLLRIGDFELTLEEFGRELNETREATPPSVPLRHILEDLLLAHRFRELIHEHCKLAGCELGPVAEERARQLVDRIRADEARQHLVEGRVADSEDELLRFYDDNRARFSRPLKVRISWLQIPMPSSAPELMSDLEALVAPGPSVELAELARRYGGAVREIDWQILASLSVIGDGKLAFFAASLPVGALSPPFHDLRTISIIRVEERTAPEAAPFEEIRPIVEASFQERHGQRIYSEISEKVLNDARFEFRFEALEDMTQNLVGPKVRDKIS